MATTMSEVFQLATDLQAKVAELAQVEPDLVYVDLSIHNVGDSQIHINRCDKFGTTEYGTEFARWTGNTPPHDGVRVWVFTIRGQRLTLPSDEDVVEFEAENEQ